MMMRVVLDMAIIPKEAKLMPAKIMEMTGVKPTIGLRSPRKIYSLRAKGYL